MTALGSKAAIPTTSEHVSFGRTSGRSEGRFPDDGRLEQLLQLQIKAVASPGFEPTLCPQMTLRLRYSDARPIGRYLVPWGRSTFASALPAKRDCAPM